MTRLFNDDCLNVLKDIPDESIDLIVTDCPYHIVSGGCTEGYANAPKGILRKDRVEVKQGKLFKHNEINFAEWLPTIFRILKPDTHCYIMINARNLKELQQSAEDAGFKFQNLLIWDKGNLTPNRWYMNAYELILMLRKGRARIINREGTSNILRVPNIIGSKLHPTEKPPELMKILIENSTNEGDTVLDPFMGVGGGGIACKDLNRDFIGIEIDEKYFKIAQERIEGKEEYKQMTIFDFIKGE